MGDKRNAYVILVGKPKRKIPIERRSGRWEDIIKMECDGIGRINLAQCKDPERAIVNMAMK
jgi:hypothetical protein